MTHDMGTQVTDSLIVHVSALLEDLIPEYLEQQKEDVKCMIAACGQGDYETILSLGHDMKGTGGAYGFDALSEIGGRIVQSALEQNLEEVRQLLGALSTYLERVEVVSV